MLSSLHDSAKDGNLETVKDLLGPGGDSNFAAVKDFLGPGADVNLPDKKFGKTPLCWAAEYGQFEVVEFLLDRGADFSLPDLIGRKPLLWAARHGYRRIVQLLLDRGDSVDSRDKNGRTPLSLAAREGHPDVVKLLLKYGDEIDSQDVKGQTPLSFAAMNGHLEIVLFLLEMGANPDLTESSRNRSPLSLAAENGYVDVVKWLLAKDCEVDSRDSNERTPLSWAVEYGDEEVVEVLLGAGADLNSGDKYNRTPLSYASELGHTEVVSALLEADDIECDLQDTYYDQTPLSWAAEGGHAEVVSLLLEMGADADSRDRAGHTPLLWAIRNGHQAVVELLLDQEVEVIVRDEENWTPLSLAAHLGDKTLTQRLLSKAAELNSKVKIAIAEAIEDALWRANESLSDAKEGLDRAKRDPSLDKVPLTKIPFFGLSEKDAAKTEEEVTHAKAKLEVNHATVLKHEAVVNLIIENDDYLNIKDYKERTLLSWAAENGHDAVLELLLSRDLSPNSTDQLNRTPISWAARGGNETTLVILLDQKVHPDWRDGAGRTPLSLAAEKGHEAVVKHLLEIDADATNRALTLPLDVKKKPAGLYSAPQGSSDNLNPDAADADNFEGGVDFDSRDFSGQTPLLFAAKEGHGKVVNLLLEKGANIEIKGADNKSLWQIIEDEIQSPGTDKFKAANLQDVQMLLESKLADGQLLNAPIKGNAPADSQFKATIVHFLQDGRREMLCRRCNVLDLLRGKVSDEVEPGERITCRWIHIPANNMRWIEIIMANHYKGLQDKWKHNIVLKKELWTGLQHRAPEGIHHARFMRPTCQALPIHSSVSTDSFDQDSEDVLRGLVLFMPYLHWETEDNLDEMKEIIKDYEMSKIGKPISDANETSKKRSSDYWKIKDLVKAYLDDKHPLHIRRTLDQFYYHTLKDTNVRDKDQTGSRYHRKFELRNKNIITMVDQLWLWVLPGFGNSPATVITSFPQRSNRVDSSGRRNDEKFTSLFSNIVAQTQDRPVENGHELAEIIASECSRIYFDTMTDRDRSLQFLEIYATSIGEITDREAQCFDKFQKTLKPPNKEDSAAIPPLKVAEDALSITEEIKLLQEVKDIRDELNIMLSVFNAQRKALKDMARIMYKTSGSNAGDRRMSTLSSQILPRVGSWGMDSMAMSGDHGHGHQHYPLPLSTVEGNINEVKDMDKYAERAYMALNHLLDLKQKQANVLEAKATHKLTTQAILQGKQTVDLTMATSSQGKMITFFTIITIVFMPLSFMAAFFAINIAEFPRSVDGLSLAYVSKYMFLISAAIIGPSIIIAFNLQNIEDFLHRRKNIRAARHVAATTATDNTANTVITTAVIETSDHISVAAASSGYNTSAHVTKGADISIEVEKLEVNGGGGGGGRKQKLRDEEQGRGLRSESGSGSGNGGSF